MKKSCYVAIITMMCILTLGGESLFAHVPNLERIDYSRTRPAKIADVTLSAAYYSWLESPTDIDYFTFSISQPVDLYVEDIVPVCSAYGDFYPWFAIIGPGLPAPDVKLPIVLPRGNGAIVVQNLPTTEPRPSFYEPFGDKSYYNGPIFQQRIETPGSYTVIFWDPQGMTGDYVAVFGTVEAFSGVYAKAAVNTVMIRQDGELHTTCE